MDASPLFRQLLRMPAAHRNVLVQPTLRPHIRAFALSTQSLPQSPYQARSLSVPRILQPSFWASMIPKPLKTRTENTHKPKEWNPATPYIILGLLVGSQAIQILWLKQERNHEMRKAEAKIGVLREVIERVQRGEDVAVEEALGTGKKYDESEWKQILKDIQNEEALFQSKKNRKAERDAAAAQEAESARGKDGQERVKQNRAKMGVESVGGVKFY